MPVYEYKCPRCGIWEELSRYPLTYSKCPKCGAPSTKLMSRPSMIIVGAKFGDGFFQKKYLDPKKSIAESMQKMEEGGTLKQVTKEAQGNIRKHLKGELWNPEYVRKHEDSFKIQEEMESKIEEQK